MPDVAERPIDVLVSDSNLLEHREALEVQLKGIATCHWILDPTSPEALSVLDQAPVYVGTKFTSDMTPHAGKLQLVLVGGAGHDGINKPALPPGTIVANTFNHEASIAEYVAATTVMVRRGILQQSRALERGVWASSVYDKSISQPRTLDGAVVGILGYGHIGQAVWRVLKSLGARGRAIKNTPTQDVPDGLDWIGTRTDLDRLLDEADVLVVCMPLDDTTRGVIGADQLHRLGSNSVVVNVSRGPLIDEDALFDALNSGIIGGAVIDVWYQYPDASGHAFPATNPFWTLPNVLMTPHISGVTRETFLGRVRDIADNIQRFAAGQPIDRVVHTQH